MTQKDHGENLSNLEALYRERYDEHGLKQKSKVWKIICEDFLQGFIKPTDVVLDMGAGTCEFINNIRCGTKYAVDVNPYTEQYAADGVVVIRPKDPDLPEVEDGGVNVVFRVELFRAPAQSPEGRRYAGHDPPDTCPGRQADSDGAERQAPHDALLGLFRPSDRA